MLCVRERKTRVLKRLILNWPGRCFAYDNRQQQQQQHSREKIKLCSTENTKKFHRGEIYNNNNNNTI